MKDMTATHGSNEALLSAKQILLGRDLQQLTEMVTAAGFPAFRAKQLHHWLYNKIALSFDAMHNIARDFRTWLTENCTIGHVEIAGENASSDGSRKFAFRLHDGNIVEGVLMREKGHHTICVSSQAGCTADCAFCVTGLGGFHRNLTSSEILSQTLLMKRLTDRDEALNVVLMGMGEPLLNLDQLIPALRILVHPEAAAVAARRVTVSTCGIVPGLKKLAEAELGVNIAVSLNASNNEFRSRIMPINRKYPIEVLLQACRDFPLKHRRRITFEYVLLAGLNDSLQNARELAHLLRGLPCKINLIPFNPDQRLPYKRPAEDTVLRFQQLLLDRNFTACVRYSKGTDIAAACGQLAGHFRS